LNGVGSAEAGGEGVEGEMDLGGVGRGDGLEVNGAVREEASGAEFGDFEVEVVADGEGEVCGGGGAKGGELVFGGG